MSEKKYPIDRSAALPARVRAVREAKRTTGLPFDLATHKAAMDTRGSDPYNTSGSFDRTQNWARVGKR